MKINFVSFLNPYRFNGGGELDNRMIIDTGRKLGHDIRLYSRVNNKYINRLIRPKAKYHTSPDLWILADIFNVPEYGLSYPKGFLEQIIDNEPFIHFDNAYVDICSKGALPCGGNKSLCSCSGGYKLSHDLYAKSILNVFLSPLHSTTINKLLGNKFIDKSFIVKPLVDPRRFFISNAERDFDYIYVGTISNYKGYQNIKKRFSGEKNFLFIGSNATGEKLFGKHIEFIDNSELLHYLNRAKNFVHLPEWKEPMGRTIIEAALCGCNIISNDNVGACSFDFDISNPVNIEDSAEKFWEHIQVLTTNKKIIHA